ncbi:DoxX family protein [Acidiluteibacter ferrifornacis]|uniref:DoxX family protein n=1 Tax=Acidiluteibacter ferrifornacis TaxID=2692424 RepID=A0A6N9NQ91_9FLAO|nr:DoxX family protein [Acidiluteibacter ferrifornacis]
MADLLGALGLILLAALRIQPKLTTLAAYGGILLMLAGIVFHLSRGEANVIGLNFLLIALLSFVVWGRTKKVPIEVKS